MTLLRSALIISAAIQFTSAVHANDNSVLDAPVTATFALEIAKNVVRQDMPLTFANFTSNGDNHFSFHEASLAGLVALRYQAKDLRLTNPKIYSVHINWYLGGLHSKGGVAATEATATESVRAEVSKTLEGVLTCKLTPVSQLDVQLQSEPGTGGITLNFSGSVNGMTTVVSPMELEAGTPNGHLCLLALKKAELLK